jgi:hypothetical protein
MAWENRSRMTTCEASHDPGATDITLCNQVVTEIG